MFVKIKNGAILFRIMLLSVLISLSSCLSFKPNGVRSAKNYYESFYVGDKGILYFIKPLAFENSEKDNMEMDIAFTYQDVLKDSATVNMTFLNDVIIREAHGLIIKNETMLVETYYLKHMFSERAGEKFKSRFTTKISQSEIQKIFNQDNLEIELLVSGGRFIYIAPKNTIKKVEKLKYNIFDLLQSSPN